MKTTTTLQSKATLIIAGFAVASFLVVGNGICADKLIVKDAAGTSDVFKVTDAGNVETQMQTSNQDIIGSKFIYTSGATAGYGNIGLYSSATAAPSTPSSGEVFAMQGIARTAYGNSTDQGSIFGIRFSAQHQGTGILNSAIAVNAYPYNGNTGRIKNAYSLYTKPWMSAGQIDNWYGLYIGNRTIGTGTIDNLYGIYVQDVDAWSYFAGNVGIGTAFPNSELQVEGYIQLDTVAGAPPSADCNSTSEYGRMKVDPAGNGTLWVCVQNGWIAR